MFANMILEIPVKKNLVQQQKFDKKDVVKLRQCDLFHAKSMPKTLYVSKDN